MVRFDQGQKGFFHQSLRVLTPRSGPGVVRGPLFGDQREFPCEVLSLSVDQSPMCLWLVYLNCS